MTFYILLLAFGQMLGSVANWQTLDSEAGRFSVEMPGEAKYSTQAIPNELGEMTMHLYTLELPFGGDDNFLYMAAYVDYPVYMTHEMGEEYLEPFFKESMNGAAASASGELTHYARGTVAGYPSAEAHVSVMNGTAIVRITQVLVGNRGYILQTIAPAEKDGNASAQRFLKSFQPKK